MSKLIVDIPDELHKKIKLEAIERGTTMKKIVIEKLEKLVELN